MADQIDVVNQLIAAAAATLYPTGPATATDPSAVAGAVVALRPGYPNADEIDAALKVGAILVGCYPDPGEENTVRFPIGWCDLAPGEQTITASASPALRAITIGGTPSSPQNVGAQVNGTPYVYPVQPGDTLVTIAVGLAALISVDTPATVLGTTIFVPAAAQLLGAVGTVGTSMRETGRARKSYRLIFWAPSPALRDAAAGAVDKALRAVSFLVLADGSAARVRYLRSDWIELGLRAGLFRRDVVLSVEHAVTETSTDAAVMFTPIALGATGDPAPAPVTTPAPPTPVVRVVADTLDFTASNNSVLAATV